jgi:hypothetical protein
MKQWKNMLFQARLALATLFFGWGLFGVLAVLQLRVMGGTDARGGYVTDLTTVGTSDFVAYLKETYGELNNALRTATYLHDRLSAAGNPFRIQGKKLVMAVITGHNTGYAFTSGGAALPVGGTRPAINPETNYSRLIQTIAFDDETIVLSQSDVGAFIDAMSLEMKGVQDTGKLVLNQALYRDKVSALARVSAITGDPTFEVDNAGLSNIVSGDRTKYLMEGQYVDIGLANGTAHNAGCLISSIDHTANTFTLSAAATSVVIGDYVYIGVLGGASNSYNRGITGLEAWLGSTSNTVWGINRATAANAKWRPVRVNASNTAVSQTIIRKLVGTVQQWGADNGQKRADNQYEGAVLLTSIPDKNAYGDVLMNMKRIVNDMELKGGWKAIEAEGYPMVCDADAPVGKIRFLNLSDWALGSPNGQIAPTLWSPDGLVLRQVPGYDRWVAMFASRLELGCMMPNRSGEIYGLNTAAYALES